MAGFFGFFDYTKPGKGIEKDAPEKRPLFLFFELLWMRLGQLVTLNLIWFVIILPLLTTLYFFIYVFIFTELPQTGANVTVQLGVKLSDIAVPFLPGFLLHMARTIPVVLRYMLLTASIVLYGPASCGMAFMLRNFVQRQHTGTSDFFEKLKQNFKQGLILGVMDIFLLGLLFFNILATAGSGYAALDVTRYVSMALLFLYLTVRHYIYLMAATFELTLGKLLKNALIFSVAGFWRNILVLIVNGAIFFTAMFLFPAVELLAVPLLLFSLTGFVAMFICYPVIKKYMLDSTVS